MLVIKQLESIKTPLVNKFYTLHHVRGRANKQDQVWVAYDNNTIIAACRLQNKPTFLFLSTVFVAPSYRLKGVATQLLVALLNAQTEPVYTFAYQRLTDFYQALGFNQVLTYTPALLTLFDAYKHRNITALKYQ
ncbi:hypothetical protein PSEHALCIP103_03530 [Pseudoalteromonas haloplanktis]|uniref:N-acetyltransferase domain-containing protein n=1 Tax=Pseudoalteromonas haloplanktis TaxID=228 RepID=A0A9W4R426_PSEHA|nr:MULTISPECIES: GNAT family N-acetyltransferase [Pseudoalteromonas]MDN3413227.1 GNAT family N-acetyltransferase [Pseudoalteromonas sp. APC 3250]MDN3488725.1 GNAT family N-acetyltransferase [Pseudoalteromonas sp. APC 3694]CAH9066157.1 hypothetical protein PSEHALCIP103_03530 [Pseudoalteromonas haloplanktis]